ncbi:type I-E CRISPR-associated protein Cas6/Cse3/CasE [Streptomyces sp. NA04227]|uniref:type I-E CRISPR-associated protein Cas6/Cse3/CasE n=1 Tax=Streptomyces sp. NA04227 TaxID=2742136 RepID=UPI001590398D|nr:type I-E CRISPR-associated protein Cas6/Cse3/CasE [Streptomyces sp. NA04227]QKW07780.1 type I-E CRISPR-associated protein Cas6/Cse3/CasE [Streptomyces sp. NA04227]
MTSLWLTRIVPDPRSREARRDLGDAVGLHRRIMSLFPDHLGPGPRQSLGLLHRIDDARSGPVILLQSAHQPELAKLPEGYGQTATRPLDPLLGLLRSGLEIRYRCTASPVRKPGATTRALYKLPEVVALHGADADEWWQRQADAAGLKVLSLHSQPLDAATGTRGGQEDRQRIRHARTRFDGVAVIVDPDQLRTKLTAGIGRGKAYGCGLLTLAPQRTAADA